VKRIYLVHHDGKPIALVRAVSQAQAIRKATEDKYEAVVADQDHLVQHLGKLPFMEDKEGD
jgi:hypothetical protein